MMSQSYKVLALFAYFWLGLVPPFALILALTSNEFDGLEKLALAISFPFAFPLSLAQLSSFEEEFPRTSLGVLKLIFLPIILVFIQAYLLDLSFMSGFLILNLFLLGTRLFAHILFSAQGFIKEKNWKDLSVSIFIYFLMLLPISVYIFHSIGQVANAFKPDTFLFYVFVIGIFIVVQNSVRIYYRAFRN